MRLICALLCLVALLFAAPAVEASGRGLSLRELRQLQYQRDFRRLERRLDFRSYSSQRLRLERLYLDSGGCAPEVIEIRERRGVIPFLFGRTRSRLIIR